MENFKYNFISFKNLLLNDIIKQNKQDILLNLNPKKLISLIPYIMACIDYYSSPSLKGENKKQLCFEIIHSIINESPIQSETKDFLFKLLDTTYDPIVESTISMSKGMYTINNKNHTSKSKSNLCRMIFCRKNSTT